MKYGKKRFVFMKMKRKLCLGLAMCLMLGVFYVCPKAAGTPFEFILTGHGGARQTLSVTKGSAGAAVVNVTAVSNASNYPVYVRIRKTNDNAYASSVGKIYGTGRKNLSYNSGYGATGVSYYMRMQTDSSSGYSASVVGNWTP